MKSTRPEFQCDVFSEMQEHSILEGIRAGRPIEIRGFTMAESYLNRVEFTLQNALEELGRPELFPVVFAVAQELTLWASLANMRQIFFERESLDWNDAEVLAANENRFLAGINQTSGQQYRIDVKERGLYLATRISLKAGGITIEVVNNANHSEPLETQLRALLAKSMQYDNIMDYFRDHPEDNLGRSMGLAFSILMLKEEQLRPELMRLGQADDHIVSRLEIPLEHDFVSIRDRISKGEEVRPFEKANLLPEGVAIQDIVRIRCPICGKHVDERVFFHHTDATMINRESVIAVQPYWNYDQGACASCLATHGS